MDASSLRDATGTEGRLLARYLLRVDPPPISVDLYALAMDRLDLQIPAKDLRLLEFMKRHPWSIGLVDGALALRRPDSVIRTKLLVMSAILEANPQFADDFLPAARFPLYLGYAAFVAFRAGVRTAIGIVLVAWI